jgi:hypothetical protein
MGGGLMQLVAYGAQDIYLTGNPQITFFKVVYRKHTNFSMEAIKQSFAGNAKFGGTVVATISRNGDLVHRMYLEHSCRFSHSQASVGNVLFRDIALVERYGDSLIKECEIEIGGQLIDKHTSMWNRVYSDLTEFNPSGHCGAESAFLPGAGSGFLSHSFLISTRSSGTLYQRMTGNGYGLNSAAIGADNLFGSNSAGATGVLAAPGDLNGFEYRPALLGSAPGHVDIGNILLPFNFWFCRNPGLALPLIALQYHEVKVKMKFEDLSKLARTSMGGSFHAQVLPAAEGEVDTNSMAPLSPTFKLWCDYIYLDIDERRRFAQVSHEYLIEQLQYSENAISSTTPSIDLNFNHPVKELIWTIRNESDDATGGRCQPFSTEPKIGDITASPVSLDEMAGNWKLKLNGHDRFEERDTNYFTRTQVWQHHTGYGGIPTRGNGGGEADSASFDHHQDSVMVCGQDSIAVYSFALKPEEHQPSGTCNFSRIDNAQLVGFGVKVPIGSARTTRSPDTDPGWGVATYALAPVGTHTTADTVKLTIFAVNYNVLRIMSGMGGLAYSN